MEILVILIFLFISGAIIGYKIGNKKPEKIKIPMVVERASDEVIWGKVNFGDNLISSYGKNQEELEHRMKQLLFDLEEIDPESVEFIIESK
jgi:hypothetical protein